MIKKLRWKFIVVTLASLVAVMGIIFGSVFATNYNKIISDVDNVIEVLIDNDGSFPKGPDVPDVPSGPKDNTSSQTSSDTSSTSSNTPPEKPNTSDSNHPSDEPEDKSLGNEKPNEGFTPETPYETRYFAVINVNGETTCNMDQQVTINENEAKSITSNLIESNKSQGFYSIYRYKIQTTDTGYIAIFVDCNKSLSSYRSMVGTTLWISGAGFVAFFILLFFLSKWVFDPVKKSYEKQNRFIANATHELKTPLTIVSANNEIIEMQFGETEETQAINKQVRSLTSMINDLTTLTKLNEQDNLSKTEKFSINNILNDLIDSFDHVYDIRNILFTYELDNDLSMEGDSSLISKLFYIMFDNANKYAISYFKVTAKKNNKSVSLDFENDTDIKEEHPERLLERFYRNPTDMNKVDGNGIGLSIAKEIIDLHKGSIKIKIQNDVFHILIDFKTN